MEIENSHRVTALDLVRGKKLCEKVFQHAIAKVQIPSRTREQQQRVESEQISSFTLEFVSYSQYFGWGLSGRSGGWIISTL